MTKIIKILMKKKIMAKRINSLLHPSLRLGFLIFTLIIVLIGGFFLKTNLPLEKQELRKLMAVLNNKISVFGQGIYYSLPRYPERLRDLVSEIVLVSEEINGLNKELGSSIQECDCEHTKSYCVSSNQTVDLLGIDLQKIILDEIDKLTNNKISGINQEIDEAISSTNGEINKTVGEINSIINNPIDGVLSEVNKKIGVVQSEFDEKTAELDSITAEIIENIETASIGEINRKLDEVDLLVSEWDSKTERELGEIELDNNKKIREMNSFAQKAIMEIRKETMGKVEEQLSELNEFMLKAQKTIEEKIKNFLSGIGLGMGEETEQFSYLINFVNSPFEEMRVDLEQMRVDLERELQVSESKTIEELENNFGGGNKEITWQDKEGISRQVNQERILAVLTGGELEEIYSRIRNLSSKTEEIEAKINNKSSEYGLKAESALEERISKINASSEELEERVNSFRDKMLGKLGVFGEFLKGVDSCRPSPVGPFGDPCLERKEIEEKKEEIRERADRLSFLQNLLEKELAALSGEGTEELRKDLDNLLNENQEIIYLTQYNHDLSSDCSAQTCVSRCQGQTILGIEACMKAAIKSEQKPIILKFETGVELGDLDLGQIKISNIKLDLPTEIPLPILPKLSPITIPFSGIDIALKRQDMEILAPITINIPQPSLPWPPEINLSCPERTVDKSSYDYSKGREDDLASSTSNETSRYFKTLEWLFEKCQELPGMEDKLELPAITTKCATGTPGTLVTDLEGCARMEGCFSPETVASTTVRHCDWLWQGYFLGWKGYFLGYSSEQFLASLTNFFQPSSICQVIGYPAPATYDINKTQQRLEIDMCSELFRQEEETVPPTCQTSPNETRRDKCLEIIESGRKWGKLPDSCKLSPVETLEEECSRPDRGIFSDSLCKLFESLPVFDSGDMDKTIAKTRERAKIDTCLELFRQEREPVPPTCQTSPNETLKKKCDEIKKSDRKEIPEPCKLLPLFIGKIEPPDEEGFGGEPEIYRPSIRTITDYPANGFCPPSFPTIPKISLPSIIIRDIKLPDFNLKPFLEINLPDFIFEDLVFPEIDLCNLDNCRDMFPSLNLRLPILKLPLIEISPIEIPELGIELRINPLQLPPIPFSMPQLSELSSLFSLTMPELELSDISFDKPKVFFKFAGIDADWKGIIAGFLKAALGIPDFDLGFCFDLNLKSSIPIRIGFEDFIFSWPVFPRIPEIPFCQDVNQFCQKVKNSLGKVEDKAKAIEDVFNLALQDKIQIELDRLTPLIKQKIEEEIEKRIRDNTVLERDIVIPGLDLNELAKSMNFPTTITIPWPEKLKKITLSEPLAYDLPKIPLSKYSKKFSKTLELKLPGFQSSGLSFKISGSNYPACQSKKPKPGNPCPTDKIESNLQKIETLKNEMSGTFQNIIKVLE